LGTIAVGLFVHWGLGTQLAPTLRDVLGDALWAVMLAWWIGALIPDTPPRTRGGLGLAVCWAVEFSQLYHAPVLDALRRTTIGRLVLGNGFDPRDLAAYAMGILIALILEQVSRRNVVPNKFIASVILFLACSAATASGQECLHGTAESADQAARRRDALTATRMINNIQVNQPGANAGQFLRHDELANAPFTAKMRQSNNQTLKRLSLTPGTDILPDWQLTLDTAGQGYWFMIKDKLDPCGFAYISNQAGLIFRAEPIR
jgi:hypothetical protein